jgi:hypothetical protein
LQLQIVKPFEQSLIGLGWNAVTGGPVAVQHGDGKTLRSSHDTHGVSLELGDAGNGFRMNLVHNELLRRASDNFAFRFLPSE